MNRPPAPPAPRVRPPAMPQRTAAVPPPRAPAAPLPEPRVDRREVRRTARDRRRALAAELRRPRVRRPRWFPLGILAAVGTLLVVPPVLAFAPILTVQRIEVPGADAAVTSAVQQALAGERGRPIALVADADVAVALARVPAVASFSLARRPPSTLEVRVVPRTPVAQQRGGAGWQELDGARVVIATAGTPFAGLPEVAVTGSTPDRAYTTAVGALAAVAARGIAVTRVQASGPDEVVLVLPDGRRVQWGGPEQAAGKAEALAAALKRAAKGATEIDVSAPGTVLTR